MVIYVKLGEKAASFSDPSGFNIAGDQVLPLTDAQQRSKKTSAAIKGGHLIRSTRTEYEASKKQEDLYKSTSVQATGLSASEIEKENRLLREQLAEAKAQNVDLTIKLEGKDGEAEDDKTDFDSMDNDQLLEYYKENFEVTEKQVKLFSKLSKEEKVTELISIENS